MSVMLLRGMTIYTYIVMNGNNAGEMVCCLVHAHLKDVLGHLQIKWHAQEMVPAMMGSEHGQVGRFITSSVTISYGVHSICSWYSMGTFLLVCWIGGMEGLVLMVYVPDMVSIVLNEPGKVHLKVMMS